MQAYLLPMSRRHAVVGSALVAGSFMLGTPTFAFADPTSAEKQAEADAALAQLNAMQSSLDNAESNYHDALEEQQIAQEKMAEAQTKIDEANDEISALQGKLSSRARSMYRTGASSIIDLLLGATTFKEFATNWDLLSSINENDSNMVQQSKDLRAQLEQDKATYAEQEKLAAQKAEEAKSVKENAQATVDAMQATYDSLSDDVAALLAQEMQAQEAEAAAKADDVVAEAATEAKQWYETINANRTETPASTNNNDNNGYVDNSYNGTDNNVSYNDNSYNDTNNNDYVDNTIKEPSYNVSTGNAVVDRAYSWVGIADYEFGACEPGLFDCSGFVSYCLSGSYSRLGSTTTFLTWPRVSDPQPGDVAVNEGHCGIYIGGGQMIHAPTYGYKVSVGAVQSGMVFVRY